MIFPSSYLLIFCLFLLVQNDVWASPVRHEPVVTTLIGTAQQSLLYANCLLVTTTKDILACIDPSTGITGGGVKWRLALEKQDISYKNQFVVGDKQIFLLSYPSIIVRNTSTVHSKISPISNHYYAILRCISLSGSLLWEHQIFLNTEQSKNAVISDASLSYDKSRSTLYIILNNSLHKVQVSNNGLTPIVSSWTAEDLSSLTSSVSTSAGTKLALLSLVTSEQGDSTTVRNTVAIGCVKNTKSNQCGDIVLVKINHNTNSVEVAVSKSSLPPSRLGAQVIISSKSDAPKLYYQLTTSESPSKKRVIMTKFDCYGPSQAMQSSSLEIDLTRFDFAENQNISISTQYRVLDAVSQYPLIDVIVEVPQSGHQIVASLVAAPSAGSSGSGSGSLWSLFLVGISSSEATGAIVAKDFVASNPNIVRKIYTSSHSIASIPKELEQFVRRNAIAESSLSQPHSVPGSANSLVRENIIYSFFPSGIILATELESSEGARVRWSRNEALSELRHAKLFSGDNVKDGNFWGSISALCDQSASVPIAVAVCKLQDTAKDSISSIYQALHHVLPNKRHLSEHGSSLASREEDHVLGVSYSVSDKELLRDPVPFYQLNLQVHNVAIIKSKQMSSAAMRLVLSKASQNPLIKAVRFAVLSSQKKRVTPQGNDIEEVVMVVADSVSSGAFIWLVSFGSDGESLVRYEIPNTRDDGLVYSPPIAENAFSMPAELGALVAVSGLQLVFKREGEDSIARIVTLPSLSNTSDSSGSDRETTFVHSISSTSGVFSVYKATSDKCEAPSAKSCFEAQVLATSRFDPSVETIVDVAYPSADDKIFTRAAVLGDDNILVKYLNPNMLVVSTVSVPVPVPASASASASSTATAATASGGSADSEESTLFVNILDTISGQILRRIEIESAIAPVHSTIVENNIVVTYWNNKAKRSELLTVALYDGVIGKYDFVPFTKKQKVGMRDFDEKVQQKNSYGSQEVLLRSSFDTSSIPLIMHRTYSLPRRVADIAHSISGKGLTNKNILITFDSGDVYPLDFRMIHPRRPMTEPTATEKEEGLAKYFPIIPLMPPASISGARPLLHGREANIISSRAFLESESLVFVFGDGSDLLFSVISPSQGFDTLSADFNYAMLLSLIALLAGAVAMLRNMHYRATLQRLWR